MSEMNETIKSLAAFFTGPDVVRYSVGLQVGGAAEQQARRFFEARAALGISGYMAAADAEKVIVRAVTPNDPASAACGVGWTP